MRRYKYWYHACGITFRSELELPGTPRTDPGRKSSACIRFGTVGTSLEGATSRGAAYEAAPGRLLLKSPVGRYLVRDGREIIVQPAEEAAPSEIRVFLTGSAFGALLLQRGVLPLHASCVRVGDVSVAFSGVSGAGKSTMAAFLQQRDYAVLGDDICPVRVVPGVGSVAFPGFPRLKLWGEAFKALGLNASDFRQPRSELEKYELPLRDVTHEPFVPLRRLYLLCETRDQERRPQGIEPIEGPERIEALLANTYRFQYLDGFGQKPEHLRTCAGMLKSLSVYRLWQPREFSCMSQSLDALETHWNDLHGVSADPRPIPVVA